MLKGLSQVLKSFWSYYDYEERNENLLIDEENRGG